VGHESFSEVDVAAFLHDKVAEYKRIVPELVEFVKAVPKSAAGKILRKELRAMEEARSAAKAA
jgi:acyl-CoA synthetase (AMP-forming)/AMP-acid ligase II